MNEPEKDAPIYVTRPLLPPLEEFLPYLRQIWDSKWLTNNGPFHHQLEQALAEYLGVRHVALFTSGTVALITALQTLRIVGEVITTPYTFTATANVIVHTGASPVLVDVRESDANIDPELIEQAITPNTKVILPVHISGDRAMLRNGVDTWSFLFRDGRWWIAELVINGEARNR